MNGKQFKKWRNDRFKSVSAASEATGLTRKTIVKYEALEGDIISHMSKAVAKYEIELAKKNLGETILEMQDIGNRLYLLTQEII